ncbi:hypothetical protein HDZ31DRAFT_77584, partial [Schizophyllum fasciatum]
MYDKIMLRLEAAQFIIGNDLDSCMRALTADHDTLHLLERINVDLQAQNSIAPAALNLTRFKLGGTLPHLKLNFSDSKYKALMRLIDVCIPHFGDEDDGVPSAPALPAMNRSSSGGLALFGSRDEYDYDDDESEQDQDDDHEEFFEANEPEAPQPELHQRVFELDFSVENLQAVVSKVTPDGSERPIGDMSFDRFGLQFGMTKYDMKVHVRLRSVAMDVFQIGADPIRFMSSVDDDGATAEDLLTVDYTRAQKASPEFFTVYEGIDQNIDVKISTFVFRAAPEPVLMLYDFIMTTFVPNTSSIDPQGQDVVEADQPRENQAMGQGEDQKIRVQVKLASIQVAFSNGGVNLATLALSTADVFVLVRPKTLHVGGRLGSLSLSNDSSFVVRTEYSQILSIEGENFADFQYQTFDPTEASYDGVKSLVVLNTASVKFQFLEGPLHGIYKFFVKLAKLKGLYDAATQAAVQSAPDVERMQFKVKSSQDPKLPEPQGPSTDFRLDLHEVSIVVLENDSDPESQAIRLGIDQIQVSQQGILALSISKLGMSLLKMGKPSESVRFLDEFDATLTMDSRPTTAQQMTNLELACKPIIFRASHRDINLITTIVNKAVSLYSATQAAPSTDDQEKQVTRLEGSHGTSKWSSRVTKSRASGQPLGKAHLLTSKEQFKGAFDGFRLVLIGDMHEQPMLHLRVKPFNVNVNDWTGEMKAQTTIGTQISYWNLTNSHWEPLIDPWTFTVSTWSAENENLLRRGRGSYAPYRIRNRTGSPIFIWADNDSTADTKDVAAVRIQNDETVDWRFDDWKSMREHVSNSAQHSIGVQFVGKPWEQVRTVPVDREGEFVFSLRPRTDRFPNRVLCEVQVVDNVKVVTIRSTYKIENRTLYPLEITLVDDSGHPAYPLEKIAPGEDFALPIEAVMQTRVRIQPDQGFGYKWCSAIRWEDLVARQSFSIKCAHSDPHEAAFRFQASVRTDARDTVARRYPKITLRLCAPIELENLLPYNIQYRIYDKNADQNWRSYLRKGGVMPVHSVDLGHLVLLNIDVQDTDFKPSEFSIVNTDAHSDFEVEDNLTLRDLQDRKLQLRLNYV